MPLPTPINPVPPQQGVLPEKPTLPPATPPPAGTNAPVDAEQIFKVRHNKRDLELRLKPDEVRTYIQKGLELDHTRGDLERRIREMDELRRSNEAQLQTMREFQAWMRARPDEAKLVDKLYKGEITVADLMAQRRAEESADPHAPLAGNQPPATNRAAPNQGGALEEILARLRGLDERVTTLAESQQSGSRAAQIAGALQSDAFFAASPTAQELASKRIGELMAQGEPLDAAKILARNELQAILDEQATAKRDLTREAQNLAAARGPAGLPAFTQQFMPQVPPGTKPADRLKAIKDGAAAAIRALKSGATAS